MKRAMLLFGGLCWFLFALGFAAFLVQYLRQGAGTQFSLAPVSSGAVLVGLIHVIGFSAASFLCFAIGVGLCVRGLVREEPRS